MKEKIKRKKRQEESRDGLKEEIKRKKGQEESSVE